MALATLSWIEHRKVPKAITCYITAQLNHELRFLNSRMFQCALLITSFYSPAFTEAEFHQFLKDHGFRPEAIRHATYHDSVFSHGNAEYWVEHFATDMYYIDRSVAVATKADTTGDVPPDAGDVLQDARDAPQDV